MYGRPLDCAIVQQYTLMLASYTWQTDNVPAEVNDRLVETAHQTRNALIVEHDVTMYDPNCWGRQLIWYLIGLCDLLIAGRFADANNYFPDKTAQFRPAVNGLPGFVLTVPPGNPSDIERLKMVVTRRAALDSKPIDTMYQRAAVEIELHRFPGLRCRVYDEQLLFSLLDAVLDVDDGSPMVPNEYEPTVCATYNPTYQKIFRFLQERPQDVYKRADAPPADDLLEYFPHLHALCQWIVHFNAENPAMQVVLTVGNGRTRQMPASVGAICWVSQDLCGFFGPGDVSLMTDAACVWDLIAAVDGRYSTE
jgi:hypothetical protein